MSVAMQGPENDPKKQRKEAEAEAVTGLSFSPLHVSFNLLCC